MLRRKAAWQVVLLALGLLLFAGLIYRVGLRAVLEALQRLGWLTPLVVIPYFTSYFVDSIGWLWVLRRGFAPAAGNPAPGLLQVFAIRAAGEAVNGITPTAYLGGEPLKAWLLQQHGVPLVPGLASVLVSKTALMLTQGGFVFLGALVALHRWRSEIPLLAAAVLGLLLGALTFGLIIGVQRRGLFGILLGISRRWSGREALLASWEADLLALDEALSQLATTDPKAAELVNLRYFAGLTIKQAAEVLGISPRTADFLWAYARAWLLQKIEGDGPRSAGGAKDAGENS